MPLASPTNGYVKVACSREDGQYGHDHGSKANDEDRSAQPFAVHGKDKAQRKPARFQHRVAAEMSARGKAHNDRRPKPLTKLIESSLF